MENNKINRNMSYREYMRKYYQNNKEKILANAKEKIKCEECLHYYSKSGKISHPKSKKHIEGVKIKQELLNNK